MSPIRGAAVVYIVFVGLLFNTLLRDVDLGGLLPWFNAVCHSSCRSRTRRLARHGRRAAASAAMAFWWLAFPAVYVFSP